ncbi:OLC1v1011108C1 [Oldenlandia corymbosa var. corymbosa]|uniref:OLC1v1011108C1 n=1 Tax=Oldenlandia corymbosa var. corymbosa TaxID=529605 RepID=A0AAV1DSY6_OLDCO|nr:OLC1v1011108C1 [Oldenlandia corymbosa var. corymbosa]
MAIAHYLIAAAPFETSNALLRKSIITPQFPSISNSFLSYTRSSFEPSIRTSKLSFFSKLRQFGLKVKAVPEEAEAPVVDSFGQFKHLLLPITDRNPYLSEGTRQAAATTASLAKKYGAEITVVVIDEKDKETYPEHERQLSSIRWHLSEGGFQEFKLLERLGEGKKPTAIIGEVADDLNLDLVVMSMEAVHSKHVDANLLAEFIPCPVLLLPL